jgi:hypothetical protein
MPTFCYPLLSWILQLEDTCVRLEDTGSSILERQFMIHVLHNLMSEIAERWDIISFQCKNRGNQNGGSNGGNTTGGMYYNYYHKPVYINLKCLKLKTGDSRLNNNNYNPSGNRKYGNRDRENNESQDMLFTATSDAERFQDDIWICDISASSHYCASDRGMFDVQDINENIQVGN